MENRMRGISNMFLAGGLFVLEKFFCSRAKGKASDGRENFSFLAVSFERA